MYKQVATAADANLGEQDRAVEDVPAGVLDELEADRLTGERLAERHRLATQAQTAGAVESSGGGAIQGRSLTPYLAASRPASWAARWL